MTEQRYFCDLASMSRRCMSSFQDSSWAALNRSTHDLIDHVNMENVPAKSLLDQLRAALQLSQSVATAWSDGAELDCFMAFNILLHQRDQALRGASPLLLKDEKESRRTAPFRSKVFCQGRICRALRPALFW